MSTLFYSNSCIATTASRVQKVVVNEESSSDIHVSSGVPQGSVLGPLLFLLYVNGATNVVFSPGTKIVLYADDMLLFKPINDAEDFMLLQDDMNSLVQWSTSSFLTFNPEKCKFMMDRLSLESSTIHILVLR